MARPERGRFLLKKEGLHHPLGVGQLLLLAGWDQLGLWVLEDRGQAGPQGVATLRLTLGRRDQDGAEVGQVLKSRILVRHLDTPNIRYKRLSLKFHCWIYLIPTHVFNTWVHVCAIDNLEKIRYNKLTFAANSCLFSLKISVHPGYHL